MKLTKATLLLKAVLIFSAVCLAGAVFGCVPAYMSHIIQARPNLSVWDFWMKAYAFLIALPVWATIVLLWQIFDTIPKNDSFTLDNARRFQWISRLAEGDLCLVAALGLFLVISGVIPALIAACLMATIFGGIVASVVFHVLGGLVRNAAEIKQDNEMTI